MSHHVFAHARAVHRQTVAGASRRAALLAGAAVLVASSAHAQTAQPQVAAPAEVDEVVVTGQRLSTANAIEGATPVGRRVQRHLLRRPGQVAGRQRRRRLGARAGRQRRRQPGDGRGRICLGPGSGRHLQRLFDQRRPRRPDRSRQPQDVDDGSAAQRTEEHHRFQDPDAGHGRRRHRRIGQLPDADGLRLLQARRARLSQLRRQRPGPGAGREGRRRSNPARFRQPSGRRQPLRRLRFVQLRPRATA